MPSVFFYISGHGFGHASRQIEIINALGAAAPALPLVVRTSAPRWLFDRTLTAPVTFESAECDTGVVQMDGLHLDEQATIQQAARFHATLDRRATEEAIRLREHGAALAIADAPPLGVAAAAAAGIPAIVVANFTWDWIYEGYPEPLQHAPELLLAIRNAYRRAEAAWRLPMHGGFQTFETIVDVPLVARHARHDAAHVRTALGLPPDRPLALASFGGLGIRDLDPRKIDALDDVGVVLTYRQAPPAAPPGVHAIHESAVYEQGMKYQDLVAAVDVVVTKPGYGIISECIANDTAILYTSRGRFAEYDVLVAAMPRVVRSRFIEQDDLLAGRWRASLRELLAAPAPAARPATDGAEVIAGMIARRLVLQS